MLISLDLIWWCCCFSTRLYLTNNVSAFGSPEITTNQCADNVLAGMAKGDTFCDWLRIIKTKLGKPCARHYKRIAFDIICVDRGIRQAFLFDYAALTAETLQQFSDIIFANHLVQNELTVVGVVEDVFIVNRNMVLNNLKHASPQLVDVSKDHRDPSLFDMQRGISLVQAMANIIRTQLQTESETCEKRTESNTSRVVHLALPDEINPTTMFGFMLEYPVLYWYNACSDHNCLDMVPLHVCKLTATLSLTKSVDAEQHHKLCRDTSSASSQHPQIVCSFSFPEALHGDIGHLVKQWHENMLARFAVQGEFSDYTLSHKVVTLPCVSM